MVMPWWQASSVAGCSGDAVAEQAAARRGSSVAPGTNVATATAGGYTAWATGIGQNARFGAAGGTGFNTSGGGAAVGADMRLGAGLAGVAVGYTGGRTTSRATGGSADVEMLHASI
jgi:hypothetical protein